MFQKNCGAGSSRSSSISVSIESLQCLYYLCVSEELWGWQLTLFQYKCIYRELYSVYIICVFQKNCGAGSSRSSSISVSIESLQCLYYLCVSEELWGWQLTLFQYKCIYRELYSVYIICVFQKNCGAGSSRSSSISVSIESCTVFILFVCFRRTVGLAAHALPVLVYL